MSEKSKISRFPAEMPAHEKKSLNHGAIEDVVVNEINVKPATNPVTPYDTDRLNSEFAKEKMRNENF